MSDAPWVYTPPTAAETMRDNPPPSPGNPVTVEDAFGDDVRPPAYRSARALGTGEAADGK